MASSPRQEESGIRSFLGLAAPCSRLLWLGPCVSYAGPLRVFIFAAPVPAMPALTERPMTEATVLGGCSISGAGVLFWGPSGRAGTGMPGFPCGCSVLGGCSVSGVGALFWDSGAVAGVLAWLAVALCDRLP